MLGRDKRRHFRSAEVSARITSTHEKASEVLTSLPYRAQVTALAELLRQTPDVAASFRIGTFVGTSASSYRKVSVADLADLRAQSSDLESFRNGEKNLMIATNVLEEGIDISACNLVRLISFTLVYKRQLNMGHLSGHLLREAEQPRLLRPKTWSS